MDIDYINEHREAVDRPPFDVLSREELARHLALIDEHAPHGIDPWHEEDGVDGAEMPA